MTKAITHVSARTKRSKKKVGILHRIEPGEEPFAFISPITEFRDHAVALVQYGSSWVKLMWEPEPSILSDRCPTRVNAGATALLNQPSTMLLKGPVRLGDNAIRGPAYILRRTVLMPFVRIREGISIEEAEERVDTMLLDWGCVSWDEKGPILICANENDLFGAMLAVG
ncbi:MAG TPA: hypothetical protein VGU24_06755 [Microvirga sp.]|jgi:hypothetical protein|nr:hypothetical protein [Microvirga sp.]